MHFFLLSVVNYIYSFTIPVFISLSFTFTFTSSIEIESINSLRNGVHLSAWYIKLQFVPGKQVSNNYKD